MLDKLLRLNPKTLFLIVAAWVLFVARHRLVYAARASHRRRSQQMTAGLLQDREVRNAVEAERRAQFSMFNEVSYDAPIVRLQETLHHQTGGQLMLRELPGTVGMRARVQHPLRCDKRRRTAG
jgi:hypothetical protein